MNIQGMGLIHASYINPTAMGDLELSNWLFWGIGRIFADFKFIAIFSILFGVGILLQSQSLEKKGNNPTPIFLQRMFWLAIFGIIHSTFIWYGDILLTYVICGLFVYWLRKIPHPQLFIIAGILLLAPTVTAWQLQTVLDNSSIWDLKYLTKTLWIPSAELVAAEFATHQSSWLQQIIPRLDSVAFMLTFQLLTLNFWKSSALMLIGMGLFKMNIFHIEQRSWHKRMLLGLVLGLTIAIVGLIQDFNHGWKLIFSLHEGRIYLYFSSLFMALGYIGGFMLLLQLKKLNKTVEYLAAIGKMALSNYILQSIFGLLLFSGFGLNWFGNKDYGELALIVVGIWLFQIYFSTWWLQRFYYGPLEWLWRSLAYKKRQPLRRSSPKL
ncbi:MAG: DUF418 domain-containing protein [Magnetococcales bacterium]|nr:DUF418 domain-containing protein [Magnetococcales bacterium]